MFYRDHFSTKALTVVTSIFFLFSMTPVAEAVAVTPDLMRDIAGSEAYKETIDVTDFEVPTRFGEVKDRVNGDNDKTIIHIQDAHCNYSAQRSIADMVGYLKNEYGTDLLFLEGGAGEYDLSVFTDISDRAVRKEVADYFVKEGRVTGPEFFAINNPDDIELVGIEDPELYAGNLDAYRKSLSFKDESDEGFAFLSHWMMNFKRKIYSSEMLEMDAKRTGYKSKEIEFKDYVSFLEEKSKTAGIRMEGLDNMAVLLLILEDEKTIDFRKANIERNILIDKLTSKLSKKDTEELTIKTLQLKNKEISAEDFYRYLFRKAEFISMDFSELENLVKYSEYIKKYEALSKVRLYEEIEEIEETLMASYITTDDQKNLYELDKVFAVLNDMFTFSLVKKDYDLYRGNKGNFNVKKFIDFFKIKAPRYKLIFTAPGSILNLDTYKDNLEEFYNYSIKRDDAFLENIASELKKKKIKVALLVTGGFHADNLSRMFADKGYSYVKVMPRLKVERDCPYFKLLSGGKSQIETMVEASVSGIAVASMFSDMGVIGAKDMNLYGLSVKIIAALKSDQGAIRLLMPYGIVTLSKEKINENSKEVGQIDGDVLYATTTTDENITGEEIIEVVFDHDNLTYIGHEPMDTLWQLAHEGEENIKAERLRDTDYWQDMLSRLAQYIPKEKIEELVPQDTWIVSRNGNALPWQVGHASWRGIHLTLTDNPQQMAQTLLHEIGAYYGNTHQFNSALKQAFQEGKSREIGRMVSGISTENRLTEEAQEVTRDSKLRDFAQTKTPGELHRNMTDEEYASWLEQEGFVDEELIRLFISTDVKKVVSNLTKVAKVNVEYSMKRNNIKESDEKIKRQLVEFIKKQVHVGEIGLGVIQRLQKMIYDHSGKRVSSKDIRLLSLGSVEELAGINIFAFTEKITFSALHRSFNAALREGRFDDAESILEQMDNIPDTELDAYQLANRRNMPKNLKLFKERAIASSEVEEDKAEEAERIVAEQEALMGKLDTGKLNIRWTAEYGNIRSAQDVTVVLGPDNWDSYFSEARTLDQEIVDMSSKNLFNGAPALIAVGSNSEFAKTFEAVLKKDAMNVRKEANDTIRRYDLGKNIIIRIFDETNSSVRETLMKMIIAENYGKERAIVFSSRNESQRRDVVDRGLEENSYVVYLGGEDGSMITPVGGSIMSGLAYLDISSLTLEKEASRKAAPGRDLSDFDQAIQGATERFAKRLAFMAGISNYQDLLNAITNDFGELLGSGMIFIKIRPVDINEIKEFYEAESAVLRSL